MAQYNIDGIINEVVTATNTATNQNFNFVAGELYEIDEIISVAGNNKSSKLPMVWLVMNVKENYKQGAYPYEYILNGVRLIFVNKTPNNGKKSALNIGSQSRLTDIINVILKPYTKELMKQLALNTAVYEKMGRNPFDYTQTLYPRFGYEEGKNKLTEITDAIVLEINEIRIKYLECQI